MRDESNVTESPGGVWRHVARATGEITVITLLFAAAGAWPVPDVNETVYLTKARHAADPSWAAGDFFLETPEAHGVFYVLFGPLAAALPLDQAAWVGRWLGWLALAAGFRRAVVPLLDGAWSRLLAAAAFSLATRWTTAAGEWVIGGCEAKVFAWALVLAALGDVVRGRFAAAVLPLGAATAAHPIVGGWALIATAVTGVWRPAGRRASRWEIAMALAGLAVAAWGVLPALGLSAGVDAAGRAAANRTYVVERLSHHLLLRSFAEALVARHVLAVLAWALLQRQVRATPSRSRLVTFTVAALAISVAGCGISLLETVAPAPAIALLRFYWFRLADVAVPLAISVAAVAVLIDQRTCLATFPGRPALARGILLAVLGADLASQSLHWPILGRPGLVPRADAKIDAASWADACAWVRDHAPADACFLTPRNTASFTWRTGRREVVAWKNSPQDARSLLAWRRRMIDCFSADGTLGALDRSTAALGAERLRLVADRYGADHMIVPVDLRTCAELPFERLYANAGFAVYALRPSATRGAASP